MSKDAWKDTGKCSECRRKSYCKTECSAHKAMMRRLMSYAFIRSAATERIYPALNHLTGGKSDE